MTVSLTFFDYEIPVLKSLVKLGGSAKTREVYPVVEEIMELKNFPDEYRHYKLPQDVVWKNKTQWAREYLKRKGQLDGSVRGVWTITEAGKERLRVFEMSGRDIDDGRAILEGIESSVAEKEGDPDKAFEKIEETHETGDILNVRGIVYEPINEQGVILLFAALCYDLDFRIESIRTRFPDAQLRRKNGNGTFSRCNAEFEFKAKNYQSHGHPIRGCDLIICWENDWKECPIEVLELKSIMKKYKN